MILLIYGAGSQAKELYDLIMRNTPEKYKKIFYIDDYREEGTEFYFGETIHGDSISERFKDSKEDLEGIVAVGEPMAREILTRRFEDIGIKLTTLIDKTSIVSPTAVIEEGTIICEYSTIHSNAEIGRGVLIQSFCDIGHDIRIGDFSVVSAGFSPGGGSKFGNRVFIGMNVSVKEKISVGDGAIIGMGSAVFKDVPENSTVIGNPARITKGNDEGKVYR